MRQPSIRYDAGVMKATTVPNPRNVPSGPVSVISKVQVTRSPCTLCLDLAKCSAKVGPPGGVNVKVASKDCRT